MVSGNIGKLKVGDINLVVAAAAGHRGEGFAAFNRFKESLRAHKIETYQDGSTLEGIVQ